MTITLADALEKLNIPNDSSEVYEVSDYMDAANEWIAEKVTDTSPAPVKLATLFLLDHLWSLQRGPAVANPIDDYGVGFIGSPGFAIPNRVLELIAPYITKTGPLYSFPDAVAFPDPVEWPT